MNKPNKFENNLSHGSVVKQLLIFAIPFIISNLIQSLYSVADMIIVGQFCGTVSMSGVNIGGQVTFLLTNLVAGLSVGATVLIGQYLGYGARKELSETIATLFTALTISSVVLSALMVILRSPILKLIQTPTESFEEAKIYLLITALGTIFIFAYNAFSAVMRGMGDSKSPLIFVSIACATNIVLDLIFVGVFKTGAAGAAVATIISQALSAILCMFYMKRGKFVFDFKLSSFKISGERLKMLLKVGIPSSVQNVIVGISFLFLTALVNTLGVTASAAVGAVGKFNGFAILPGIAISSSISAMAAQNIGAGQFGRARKTMGIGIILACGMSICIFIIAQLFPVQILSLFDSDPEMIASGVAYMRTFAFDYLIAPIMFCFNGLFIGAGHTTFSLINSVLSSLAIRIPIAYICGFVLDMGLMGVGLAGPVASAVALCIGILYFASGKWKTTSIVNVSAQD